MARQLAGSAATKLSKRKQSMVKIDAFDILFDAPEGVYYAGTDVTGTISLNLNQEKKVDEILLELKGKAKTYWTKHSGRSRQHYTDSEPYFCEQFNTEYTHAFGKPKERVLAPGRHEVPFSYRLPASLPSSFEGEFGHCRFTCTATLERPWDFDIVCCKVFTVIGLEDLNEINEAKESIEIEDSTFDLISCWRKMGQVRVNVQVPKTGYAPGENLHFKATIENDSSKSLKICSAQIKQYCSYRAKSFMGAAENKETIHSIVKKDHLSIAPKEVVKWEESLEIPPVPPKLIKCKVIDINYALELSMDQGFTVIAPLYIGNIPYLEHHAEDPPHSGKDKQHKPPKDRRSSITSPIHHKYPYLPEPVFKESYFGKFDTRENKQDVTQTVHGDHMYAPWYPCYHIDPRRHSTIDIHVKEHSF